MCLAPGAEDIAKSAALASKPGGSAQKKRHSQSQVHAESVRQLQKEAAKREKKKLKWQEKMEREKKKREQLHSQRR